MGSNYFGKFLAKKKSQKTNKNKPLGIISVYRLQDQCTKVYQEFFNVLAVVGFLKYFWLNNLIICYYLHLVWKYG